MNIKKEEQRKREDVRQRVLAVSDGELHGIIIPKGIKGRIEKNRTYRAISRDIEEGKRKIRNTPKIEEFGGGFKFLDVMMAGGKNMAARDDHNEKRDDLKKSVEEMKLSRVDLIEEIIDDEKEKQKMMEKSKVKIDQTVIHGDYVDDRDMIVKDSVVNKSKLSAGGKSKSEELREAKALLDDGIIDDDEFKQMKKEILG